MVYVDARSVIFIDFFLNLIPGYKDHLRYKGHLFVIWYQSLKIWFSGLGLGVFVSFGSGFGFESWVLFRTKDNIIINLGSFMSKTHVFDREL